MSDVFLFILSSEEVLMLIGWLMGFFTHMVISYEGRER